MTESDRLDLARTASRRGFWSGVRGAFGLGGRGRPAPPMVRRSVGSPRDDILQLSRDSDRLFKGPTGPTVDDDRDL